MRPTKLPLVFFLSLLLTVLCVHSTARGDDRADDNDGDEYDVNARVVRISLIQGEVNLKRHDSNVWVTARLNTPLVEGDTLATGANARAEIQIDARNFVRVAADSVIKIVTLRDEGIALSLAEGTATLRLARFDRDHEYFEIDAPKTTIAAETKGVYRLDVERKGAVHLTARDGGRARVYSDTAGFTVRDGHSATLAYEGDPGGEQAGDWQTSNASAKDSWDDWVKDRESYLASRFKYDQNMRYYEADIWGAEDLDAYGGWSYANDYGWIWRPNITIINNYSNWAPYRFGQWTWVAPYGWTWIGDEPWGWAPYHYGRWVYYDNYWAWCPHSYYRPRRSWWRPALVAFVSIDFNFGSNYCWYPLSYHQRDPRSVYFQRNRDRLTPLRSDELANLRRINPAYLRAVTAVPARDFGNHAGRLQPANGELARRVIGAQPLRGDLPVRPTDLAGDNQRANRGARPGPAVPAAAVSLRPTGAATRTPGVSLDNELRRSRIFNGRDPITAPSLNNGVRTQDPGSTGAVARPTRPRDPQPNSGSDRGLDLRRNPDGADNNVTPVDRQVRPRPRADRPNPGVDAGQRDRNPPAREVERPPAREPEAPARPARPDRNEQPERTERPSRRDESPAPRPSSPPQSEAPRSERPQRYEPPQRSEPPPQRYEPPQRSEPPPQRYEPPQRSEPPPQRSEPPPQRSEPPPRSDPPAPRPDPPAERSEPARPAKPSDPPTRRDRKRDD